MRTDAREEPLETWEDLCTRPGVYLARVREAGSSVVVRLGRYRVRLGRRGLAGGGPLARTVPAGQIEEQRRQIREDLEGGGVVAITRWGVIDGYLEVVP